MVSSAFELHTITQIPVIIKTQRPPIPTPILIPQKKCKIIIRVHRIRRDNYIFENDFLPTFPSLSFLFVSFLWMPSNFISSIRKGTYTKSYECWLTGYYFDEMKTLQNFWKILWGWKEITSVNGSLFIPCLLNELERCKKVTV